MAENFSNDYQTTLSAAIADGVATAISVVSGTGAPAANFRIRVGNEYMLVTSTGAGTNWTVTRGIEGSTAAAHVSGTVVAHVTTTGGFQQYVTEQLTGGLVDASFASLVVAGALTVSGLTAGSVPFAGVDGLISQDNANFFWDDTNNRLGVGTNAPGAPIHVVGVTGDTGLGMKLTNPDSHSAFWRKASGVNNETQFGNDNARVVVYSKGKRFLLVDHPQLVIHGEDGGETQLGFRITNADGAAIFMRKATGVNNTAEFGSDSQTLTFWANGAERFRVVNVTGNFLLATTTDDGVNKLQVNGSIRHADATALIRTSVALNNGAGVGAGTLANAPAAGNPTKWIPINDNGTTRYVPAW